MRSTFQKVAPAHLRRSLPVPAGSATPSGNCVSWPGVLESQAAGLPAAAEVRTRSLTARLAAGRSLAIRAQLGLSSIVPGGRAHSLPVSPLASSSVLVCLSARPSPASGGSEAQLTGAGPYMSSSGRPRASHRFSTTPMGLPSKRLNHASFGRHSLCLRLPPPTARSFRGPLPDDRPLTPLQLLCAILLTCNLLARKLVV